MKKTITLATNANTLAANAMDYLAAADTGGLFDLWVALRKSARHATRKARIDFIRDNMGMGTLFFASAVI